jgi:hypothetical protein
MLPLERLRSAARPIPADSVRFAGRRHEADRESTLMVARIFHNWAELAELLPPHMPEIQICASGNPTFELHG